MPAPRTVLIIGGPLDGERYTGPNWYSIGIDEGPGQSPAYYRTERLEIFGRVVLVAPQPGLSQQERNDLLWKHLCSDMHDLAVGS